MEQKLNPFTSEQIIKIEEAIRRSRQNLVALRYYMLMNGKGEYNPPDYHFEWSEILLNEKDNFAIQGYRESGKGQIVLRSYPLYAFRFPSTDRDYIVLIKQNQDLASDKLIELENEYLSNPLLNSNLIEVRQKSARVFSVDVKNGKGEVINIRIEAYGKGSSIRGLAHVDRRPKICVIDDPQNIKDTESDTILETDWNWFLSDVKFLGQYTRIFLIGNNLGEKCIIERVFNSHEDLGFQTRKVKVQGLDGVPTWPEKFTTEFIDKEKESYRRLGKIDIWMRERMCESTSPETRIFHRDDFIRYSALYLDIVLKNTNIFITVDPASSKNPGSCYRAMPVVAVTEDNRWIIVDVAYGRWASDDFIDELFKLIIKWTPYLEGVKRIPVGFEKGHFKQVLEPFIYREMQRRNIYFDIHPIEHASIGSKLERVKMLAPRFRAKTISLPESATWLAELEAELMGVTIDGFKSEYTDLVDSLAMMSQLAKPPVKGRINTALREFQESLDTPKYNPFTMSNEPAGAR